MFPRFRFLSLCMSFPGHKSLWQSGSCKEPILITISTDIKSDVEIEERGQVAKWQKGQLGHRGAVGGGRCPSGSLFACCRAIKIKWEMNVADAASRWRPGCMLRRYLHRTVTRFVCIRMQIGPAQKQAACRCNPQLTSLPPSYPITGYK